MKLFGFVIITTLGFALALNEEVNNFCTSLPILIVSALSPLPTLEECQKAPISNIPGPNCMKRTSLAEVKVLMDEKGEENCLGDMAGSPTYTGSAHYRGASSLNFASKHQMNLKFDNSINFLNISKGKDWILNGPWIDTTGLRNPLAHWLFRNTGRYSPRTQHMILFLRNDHQQLEYHGLYIAMEKIGFGKERLGLAELTRKCQTNEELSGGWAWQYNPFSYGSNVANFVIDQYQTMFGLGARPTIEYPKADRLTDTMRNYFIDPKTSPLVAYYKHLFDHMEQPDDLQKHIDIGSFVDYMLHTELSMNQDAYLRSAWYFKDRNQPINAGPVWDFNLAYGLGSKPLNQWLFMESTSWKRLRCNYRFASLAISRWETLRSGIWSNASITSFLNRMTFPIQTMLQKCPNAWNSDSLYCLLTGSTKEGNYTSNVNDLLKSVLTRATWMDHHILEMYTSLNGTICAAVGTLPKFNCAKNGNDSGCLTEPYRYASQVSFPPVRHVYLGPSCQSTPRDTLNNTYRTDPCWLSVGKSVNAGSKTPFCSGYGQCPPGIGAKCTCNNKSTRSDCLPEVNRTVIWLSAISIFIIIGLGILRYCTYGRQKTYQPIP